MIITRPKNPYATPLDELQAEVLPLRIDNLYDLGFPNALLNQFDFPEDWAQWFHDRVKDEIGNRCSRSFFKDSYAAPFYKLPTLLENPYSEPRGMQRYLEHLVNKAKTIDPVCLEQFVVVFHFKGVDMSGLRLKNNLICVGASYPHRRTTQVSVLK